MTKAENLLLLELENLHSVMDCEEEFCSTCYIIVAFYPNQLHPKDPRKKTIKIGADKITRGIKADDAR